MGDLHWYQKIGIRIGGWHQDPGVSTGIRGLGSWDWHWDSGSGTGMGPGIVGWAPGSARDWGIVTENEEMAMGSGNGTGVGTGIHTRIGTRTVGLARGLGDWDEGIGTRIWGWH